MGSWKRQGCLTRPSLSLLRIMLKVNSTAAETHPLPQPHLLLSSGTKSPSFSPQLASPLRRKGDKGTVTTFQVRAPVPSLYPPHLQTPLWKWALFVEWDGGGQHLLSSFEMEYWKGHGLDYCQLAPYDFIPSTLGCFYPQWVELKKGVSQAHTDAVLDASCWNKRHYTVLISLESSQKNLTSKHLYKKLNVDFLCIWLILLCITESFEGWEYLSLHGVN
jgi:hypothetical protein